MFGLFYGKKRAKSRYTRSIRRRQNGRYKRGLQYGRKRRLFFDVPRDQVGPTSGFMRFS